jgi:hypothetical protein
MAKQARKHTPDEIQTMFSRLLPELTAQQQMDVMRSISQTAAAWLVDRSPRVLRDQPSLARDHAGNYNAQELVRWAVGRAPRPELAPADLEKLMQAAEEVMVELSPRMLLAILDLLEALQKTYGDHATVVFADLILEVLQEHASDAREALRPLSYEEEREEAELQRKREADKEARESLRIAIYCDTHKMLRQGREWIRVTKPPAGFAVDLVTCPKCEVSRR